MPELPGTSFHITSATFAGVKLTDSVLDLPDGATIPLEKIYPPGSETGPNVEIVKEKTNQQKLTEFFFGKKDEVPPPFDLNTPESTPLKVKKKCTCCVARGAAFWQCSLEEASKMRGAYPDCPECCGTGEVEV